MASKTQAIDTEWVLVVDSATTVVIQHESGREVRVGVFSAPPTANDTGIALTRDGLREISLESIPAGNSVYAIARSGQTTISVVYA